MVLHSESRRRVVTIAFVLSSIVGGAAFAVACTAFSGPRSDNEDASSRVDASPIVVGSDGGPADPDADVATSDSGAPPGCNERALSFDGTGKFALIPDSSELDLTGTDFTVEAWIKPETMGEGHIVSHHDHNNSLGWAFLVKNDNIEIRLYGVNKSGGANLLRTGGNGATPYVMYNRWAHVAGVRQGQKIFVFYNGEPAGNNTTIAELDQKPLAGPLSVGRLTLRPAGQNNDFPFRGLIDEIRISKVARYTQKFTPPTDRFTSDPDTIALYHLDEDNGEVALNDATGINTGAFSTEAPPKRVDAPCIDRR